MLSPEHPPGNTRFLVFGDRLHTLFKLKCFRMGY